MNKPLPKTELLIKQAGDNRLFIYAMSEDAIEWIESESSQFGKFYKPNSQRQEIHYDLFIYPVYDANEVIVYLKSYLRIGEDTD